MAPKRAGPAVGRDGPVAAREAKRRRLSDVIATPGVSGKALARVAKKLAEPGRAAEVTHRAIISTIDAVFDDVGTTIELPMIDDEPPFAWKLARIDKLLRHACNASPVYSELLATAVSSVRGAPLHQATRWL